MVARSTGKPNPARWVVFGRTMCSVPASGREAQPEFKPRSAGSSRINHPPARSIRSLEKAGDAAARPSKRNAVVVFMICDSRKRSMTNDNRHRGIGRSRWNSRRLFQGGFDRFVRAQLHHEVLAGAGSPLRFHPGTRPPKLSRMCTGPPRAAVMRSQTVALFSHRAETLYPPSAKGRRMRHRATARGSKERCGSPRYRAGRAWGSSFAEASRAPPPRPACSLQA